LDENENREDAVRILISIGEDAVPALIQVLKDDDRGVRYYAAYVLGNIRSEDAVPALIPLLQDQYEWVRVASAQALKKIGPSEALKAVEEYRGKIEVTASEISKEEYEEKISGIVRGKVLDALETENPVPGASVVIVDPLGNQYEATTETDGTYRIEEVSPGEYLFTIVAPGYVPRRGFLAVTVISDGDHYVDLKITRKGFLKKFSFALALCVVLVIAFVLNRSHYRREKKEDRMN